MCGYSAADRTQSPLVPTTGGRKAPRHEIASGVRVDPRCTHVAHAALETFERIALSLQSIIGTDRSLASEGRGHRFESCRARHFTRVRSGHMGYGLYRRHG